MTDCRRNSSAMSSYFSSLALAEEADRYVCLSAYVISCVVTYAAERRQSNLGTR